MTQCSVIFYEHDDLDKEQQRSLWQALGLPEPTVQIDTGGKSIHSFWVLQGYIKPAQWKVLQTDLLAFADGDRSLKNPSRVMRLAGCYHKGTGQQSTIITNSGKRYSYEEMRSLIPSHKVDRESIQTAQPESKPQPEQPDLNDFLQHEVYPKLTAEQLYNWAGHDFQPRPGDKLQGNCPFHESTTHTAFWVEPTADGKTYAWACPICTENKKENPISYRHRRQGGNGAPRGKDFLGIVKELADQVGATMPDLPEKGKTKSQKQCQVDNSKPPELPRASILATELAEKYQSNWVFNAENRSWYGYESESAGIWSAHPEEGMQKLIQTELDLHPMNSKGYSFSTVKSVMGLLSGHLLTQVAGSMAVGESALKRSEAMPHTWFVANKAAA